MACTATAQQIQQYSNKQNVFHSVISAELSAQRQHAAKRMHLPHCTAPHKQLWGPCVQVDSKHVRLSDCAAEFSAYGCRQHRQPAATA
jgi:hypothetical protein